MLRRQQRFALPPPALALLPPSRKTPAVAGACLLSASSWPCHQETAQGCSRPPKSRVRILLLLIYEDTTGGGTQNINPKCYQVKHLTVALRSGLGCTGAPSCTDLGCPWCHLCVSSEVTPALLRADSTSMSPRTFQTQPSPFPQVSLLGSVSKLSETWTFSALNPPFPSGSVTAQVPALAADGASWQSHLSRLRGSRRRAPSRLASMRPHLPPAGP